MARTSKGPPLLFVIYSTPTLSSPLTILFNSPGSSWRLLLSETRQTQKSCVQPNKVLHKETPVKTIYFKDESFLEKKVGRYQRNILRPLHEHMSIWEEGARVRNKVEYKGLLDENGINIVLKFTVIEWQYYLYDVVQREVGWIVNHELIRCFTITRGASHPSTSNRPLDLLLPMLISGGLWLVRYIRGRDVTCTGASGRLNEPLMSSTKLFKFQALFLGADGILSFGWDFYDLEWRFWGEDSRKV